MEIYKTSTKGYEIDVIFNGSHYFFFSSFAGLVGIAERDYDLDRKYFRVKYGNRYLVGGSLGGSHLEKVIERFISKHEQRYISVNCEFVFEQTDLNDHYLSIEAKKY